MSDDREALIQLEYLREPRDKAEFLVSVDCEVHHIMEEERNRLAGFIRSKMRSRGRHTDFD